VYRGISGRSGLSGSRMVPRAAAGVMLIPVGNCCGVVRRACDHAASIGPSTAIIARYFDIRLSSTVRSCPLGPLVLPEVLLKLIVLHMTKSAIQDGSQSNPSQRQTLIHQVDVGLVVSFVNRHRLGIQDVAREHM
jgi:hypothetical protein